VARHIKDNLKRLFFFVMERKVNIPKDKALQMNSQNVYRKGSEGQNYPNEKSSIGGIPKDKTLQMSTQNVYRRHSEGQKGSKGS
ncbi:hypothetical protein V7659_12650, partial [Neobacillus drentensis]